MTGGEPRAERGSFCLGPWTVQPARNRIVCGERAARLGPKVMATLVLLAEQPGAVVTKEMLVARVWDGDAVTDEVVTSLVYGLRRALDDRARAPRFIETIRGRGYRLVARVEPIQAAEPPTAEPGSAARPAGTGLALPPGPSLASASKPANRRHAGAWRRRWIAAAALVITALGAVSVIVEWPIGGISGDLSEEAARADLDPAAAESYALGRHFLHRGTASSFEKARRYFSETIAHAPGFAPARVGLAEAWLEAAPAMSPADQHAAFHHARQAAESALVVDEDLPRAHRALGWISLQHTRNPDRAARFFERVAGQQADDDRHLGRYLSARGQHGEAMAVMSRHVAAEPASKPARLALAEVFYRARQYADALHELDRVEDLDAHDVEVARLRMDVLAALGHHSEALQACRRDLELSGEPFPTSTALGSAFAQGGLLGARRLLFHQLASSAAPTPDPVRLAQLSARIGEAETSLAWLDRADRERRADLVWLDVDPAYDTLRSVPRFQTLLQRLGLEPTPGS